MLAHDLAAEKPSDVNLVTLEHSALDVADERALSDALDRVRPALVINTAAWTRVDDAEHQRAAAWRVNAEAPGIVGRQCAARGVRVVHFSTDYVFDGAAREPYAEDARPAPLSVYGESKLEGERALAESGARALVVRTQWLYGSTGHSFVAAMWDRATAGTPTRVVNDQTGRPTSAASLARAVWHLVGAGATGTLHVANGGVATWYDVALRIFTTAGAAASLVACSSAEYPAAARRPSYSVLDTGRFERESGMRLPAWTEDLDRWIEARRARYSRLSRG